MVLFVCMRSDEFDTFDLDRKTLTHNFSVNHTPTEYWDMHLKEEHCIPKFFFITFKTNSKLIFLLTGYIGKFRACLVCNDVSKATLRQRLFLTTAIYFTRKIIRIADVEKRKRDFLFHSLVTKLSANSFFSFVVQTFIANFIFLVIDGDFKISFIWENWGWKCYVANWKEEQAYHQNIFKIVFTCYHFSRMKIFFNWALRKFIGQQGWVLTK